MTELSTLHQNQSWRGRSAEIVVAGTRFSTEAGAFLVNGKAVSQGVWQERLRGARELQRAVSEIYELYPA